MKISKEKHVFKMSPDNLPAAKCDSGDVVIFETMDCFCNALIPENTTFGKEYLKNTNPATGPLYINNAKIGDTLKIDIIDIQVGDVGIYVSGPANKIFEVFFSDFQVDRIKVEEGFVHLSNDLIVKSKPMIGVIGLADDGGTATMLPGIHGGNLDCNDICKGSSLYLPVSVEGGLLAMGDLHALMGDGEIGECGLEIHGTVIVKVTVIKDMKVVAPLIETNTFIELIGLGNTLEEATHHASQEMFRYLVEALKLERRDAARILCLCSDLKICQQANKIKTVAMRVPKYAIVK